MYMALFTTNSNNYNHNFASTMNHLSSLRTSNIALYEKPRDDLRVNRPFFMHAYIRAYFRAGMQYDAPLRYWCIPKAGFIDTKTDIVLTILTS